MPEAVIVDTIRTPIGRAFKGSLSQVRPDDMVANTIDQLLDRNPGVDPASVEDVITGCGMTQGEQAYNIGRIAVLLSQKLPDSITGWTIARYCASSLNAIRIGADSIRAGTATCTSPPASSPSAARARTPRPRCPTRRTRSSRATTAPQRLHLDGRDRRERRRALRREARAQDEFAKRSQDLAVESRDSGFFDREIIAVEMPDGRRREGRRPARRHDGREARPSSSPCSARAARSRPATRAR